MAPQIRYAKKFTIFTCPNANSRLETNIESITEYLLRNCFRIIPFKNTSSKIGARKINPIALIDLFKSKLNVVKYLKTNSPFIKLLKKNRG